MAVKVTDVPLQTEVELASILTEGVTLALPVIVISLLVAVVVVMHDALEVMITLTTSLLFNVVEEKKLLFVPAFTPLTCH